MRLRAGTVSCDPVLLSRQADRFSEIDAEAAPDVDIELDLDADELVAVIEDAVDETDTLDYEGNVIHLPFEFVGRDEAATALAMIAGHLASEAPPLLAHASLLARAKRRPPTPRS